MRSSRLYWWEGDFATAIDVPGREGGSQMVLSGQLPVCRIRQALSLGKVNLTRQSSPIPIARSKARAIAASAPGGPLNLFKPGAGKVVPEPQSSAAPDVTSIWRISIR